MIIRDDEVTTEQYEFLIGEQHEVEQQQPEIRDSIVNVFGGQYSMDVTYYDR